MSERVAPKAPQKQYPDERPHKGAGASVPAISSITSHRRLFLPRIVTCIRLSYMLLHQAVCLTTPNQILFWTMRIQVFRAVYRLIDKVVMRIRSAMLDQIVRGFNTLNALVCNVPLSETAMIHLAATSRTALNTTASTSSPKSIIPHSLPAATLWASPWDGNRKRGPGWHTVRGYSK